MIKESHGKRYNPLTKKEELIYCPSDAFDCPYYKNGVCYIKNPVNECDDFSSVYNNWEEWEEDYE